MAPARTGKDSTKRIDVNITDQINKGSLLCFKPLAPIENIVVKKFIDPAIEAAPAKCKLKIPQSTLAPGCNNVDEIGGYKVQPVPTPPDMKVE